MHWICRKNNRRVAAAVATSILLAGWHLAMAQEAPPNRGAQSLRKAATNAFNGNILFQRGFAAASDLPYNRGGRLYSVDPVSGAETLFGTGSQPNSSFDASKLVFNTGNANNVTQLFVANAGDYSSKQGLVLAGGGSPLLGLYPKLSPNNAQVAYQKVAVVGGVQVYHTSIVNTQLLMRVM